MREMMRAYAVAAFDEAPRIQEASIPTIGPRDVRIRVEASSVNPYDAMAGAGLFKGMSEYRLPAVLGRDMAGTIDEVGSEVTQFRSGDQVLGMVKRDYIGDGTFADFVIVPEDAYIARRPDGLNIQDAGALGLASLTAQQCLSQLDRSAGDAILVNGATGGVGAFVVQLAAISGLHVVATARPGDEEDHVRQLGASQVVDWSADIALALHDLYPQGVDGVVDLVSRAPQTFASIARLARPGGSVVTTLSAARNNNLDGRITSNVHSVSDPMALLGLANLVVSGQLVVPMVDDFPFERIDEAFELLASGPRGKVGLRW